MDYHDLYRQKVGFDDGIIELQLYVGYLLKEGSNNPEALNKIE